MDNGNTQQRRQSDVSLPVDDDYDSDISLTSTVIEQDSEIEYEVQDILAEDVIEGKTCYLMSWAGFPVDEVKAQSLF